MKPTKTLITTAGLLLGLLVAAPAQALTYRVTEADRDSSVAPFSGGHAFWLPDNSSGTNIPNGDSPKFLFINDSGRFNVSDDMTTAHLTGTLQAQGDSSSIWDVDIMFFLGMDYDTFANDHIDPNGDTHDGSAKEELYSDAYVDNGGTIDPTTWRYFYMDESQSTLTGAAGSGYEGVVLDLFQRPDGDNFGKYIFQMGEGANGKNLNFGASVWLGYTTADTSNYASTYDNGYINDIFSGIGDINIDLEPIPEPISAGLTLMGLGALTVTTRRRRG